ncbi:hypothetical protein Tco_0941111 [Tanacetum coccineum]|uniref:Uncharacterized protein n=1 Tax=Tanacetum coccineum TaxID=301880 RepID=A0ABQ5DPX0_9ASTR
MIGPSTDALPFDREEGPSIIRVPLGSQYGRWMPVIRLHSEGMSLRTTVMAQQSEIVEFHVAAGPEETVQVIQSLHESGRWRQSWQLAETLKMWEVEEPQAQMTRTEIARELC